MCSPAAAVGSQAGSVPKKTGATAAPILSAKGPELWCCTEQGTALLGKGLLVMAGQEFGSQDLFLSNPRKELSVTRCSHSSVMFSSLLILWYTCLFYFWTLVFISSMLLWVLILHRIILILCCGTRSYPPGRTSNTNCCLTFLKDPYSTTTQVWYNSLPTNLTVGSQIHSLQPISG